MLSAFFASVFSNRNSCTMGIQTPELEDSEQEQNDPSTIQEEMVSDLLYHKVSGWMKSTQEF